MNTPIKPAIAGLAAVTAIAQHHLLGSETQRAVRWSLLAAQRNLEVIAVATAKPLLEGGLVRLAELPAGPDTDATRIDYLDALATALHWGHAVEAAQPIAVEALALAERLGDKHRLLETLVTAGKNRALRGKSRESADYLTRAVALADELGNDRTGARARVNLGRAYFFLGDYGSARETFEAAVTLARAAGLPGWNAAALSFLGYLRVLAGAATRDRGFADLAEAVAIQERMGDRGGMGYSYNLMYEVQLQAGRLREAETAALRNAEIAQELGIADDHTVALLNHAIVCLELGELERAQASAEACLKLAEQWSHAVAWPIAEAVGGLVAIWRGELGAGLALVAKAMARAEGAGGYVQSIVAPYCIEAQLLTGRLGDALNGATALAHLLEQQESPDGRIRLAQLQAEIHLRMNQPGKAEELAEKAIRSAMELDARGLLVRALCGRAAIARQVGHGDYAAKVAERALNLAGQVGGRFYPGLATAELAEAGLAKNRPDARNHFAGLQALADQAGAPGWRAQALFGQSVLATGAEHASQLLVQAQQIVKALAAGLPDDQARPFLDQPSQRRILDKIPGLREDAGATPEASELTFERLQRVSGELVSVASQYGLLFKEWTTKSEQLERLNALARQINETLVIDDVLDLAVRMTLDITRAERGFIFLVDPDRAGDAPTLVRKGAFNQFGRPIPDETCAMSVCQRVVETGEALAVMDASADVDLQSHASVAALNLRTVMCVPLQLKHRTLGVLYVDSQAVVTTFTEKDLVLLRGIASHAAVAIENAMLYETLAKRAVELERALELYRQADYEASTDMLTGLRNRRFFAEQAGRELDICRRYGRRMSVLALDIDHFKRFNDVHGHAVGDDVLRAMGRVLAANVRAVDLPARFGGEEFVVLAPDTDAEGALLVAERIRQAVAAVELGWADGKPLPPITVSVGVATFHLDADLDALLARADAALYEAKAAGRNQVLAAAAVPVA